MRVESTMTQINGPAPSQGSYPTNTLPNIPELAKTTRTSLNTFRKNISDLIANPNLAFSREHLSDLAQSIQKMRECVKSGQFLQGDNAPKTDLADNLSSALQIVQNILEAPVDGDVS